MLLACFAIFGTLCVKNTIKIIKCSLGNSLNHKVNEMTPRTENQRGEETKKTFQHCGHTSIGVMGSSSEPLSVSKLIPSLRNFDNIAA